MTQSHRHPRRAATWTGCLVLGALSFSAGCQVDVGGQTLPSPYYLWDDVQYFPAGPEFKLYREAEALKAAKEAETARRPRRAGAGQRVPEVQPDEALPTPPAPEGVDELDSAEPM